MKHTDVTAALLIALFLCLFFLKEETARIWQAVTSLKFWQKWATVALLCAIIFTAICVALAPMVWEWQAYLHNH